MTVPRKLIVRNNWIIPRQTKIKSFIRPAKTREGGKAQPYGIAASTQLVGGCTRCRDASKSSHGQGVIGPRGRGSVENQSATAPAHEPAHCAQSTNVDGARV